MKRKIIQAKPEQFPYMTMAEIKEKYPNHWVGVAEPELDENNINVTAGYVYHADANYDNATSEIGRYVGFKMKTIVYTGKTPDRRRM